MNDDGSFTQISGIFNGDFALLCGPAAVDCEGGAGNLIGRRRTEEGNGLAQLLRRHEGSRRLLLAQERRCRFLLRSEEHTSELQSLMSISYAVFCLKKKK